MSKQILSNLFKSNRLKREEELVEAYRTFKNELIKEVTANKKIISDLTENNKILAEENKKLIEWIEKIINEIGSYEVSERNCIRVPIYKNIKSFGYCFGKSYRNKEIVLPQIVITKYEEVD